jgi:hypothetical protein
MQENKMKRYDLYIGCNVTGKTAHSPEHVRSIAEQALAELGFDCCTFTDAIGMWQGEHEQTVICTVCTDCIRERVLVLAGLIKDYLEQESIMVIESEPKITFIS